MQQKLENSNNKMMESHSSMVRSSQQFMEAKESMAVENVQLKKTVESLQRQLEVGLLGLDWRGDGIAFLES